ncbi:DUF4157 domain-containing protein [Parabacteroides sp. APC149_11_2_Y6]
MKEYAKKPENQSRPLDSNSKASRQAPINVILQQYKEQSIQRYAESADEELIQGISYTTQHKTTDEDEFLQGKFESTLTAEQAPIQREKKTNNTGLPDSLKTGIENISGYSMDDVKVHFNSDKPAKLQALAYTQGANIHVAPGQEKHLSHEAWHMVQQNQGCVQSTMQLKGVNEKDNEGLVREADMMRSKAIHAKPGLSKLDPHNYKDGSNVIQQVSINGDVVSQKVLETYNGLHPAIKSYIRATAEMDDFFTLPENNQIEFLLGLQSYLPMIDSIIRQQAASRTITLNSADSVDIELLRRNFFLANPDFINEALKLYRNMNATFHFPTVDGFTTISILYSQKPVPAIKLPPPIKVYNGGFRINAGADKQTPTKEQLQSGNYVTKLNAGNTQTLCLGWATAVHLQKSGNGYRIVKLITQKPLFDKTNTLHSIGEEGKGVDKYMVYNSNAVGQTITNVFTLSVSSCSFTVLGDADNMNIVIMHINEKPHIPLEQVLAGGVSPTIFTRMCISRVTMEQDKEDEIVGLMRLETIVRNLRDVNINTSHNELLYDCPQQQHEYIGVDLLGEPRIYGQVGATQALVGGVAGFLSEKKEWITENTYRYFHIKKNELEYVKQIEYLLAMADGISVVLGKNLKELIFLLINKDVDKPYFYIWITIREFATDGIPQEMKSQLAGKINESNGHFDQPL